ncbi:MAG TPA: hypothetical protein VD906_12000 [Caulobacteraceae bacterium]|nr:hypothetical protein [Caulobacteraceae bacterium]
MRKSILIAAALLLPLPSMAAEPSLPTEPWPRAVACQAHLFLIIQNAQAKGAPKTAAGGIRVLQAALGNWHSAAAVAPEYSKERLGQEVEAYVTGPLGAGEGAIANEVRAANAEVCVSEAVNAELEALEKKQDD